MYKCKYMIQNNKLCIQLHNTALMYVSLAWVIFMVYELLLFTWVFF